MSEKGGARVPPWLHGKSHMTIYAWMPLFVLAGLGLLGAGFAMTWVLRIEKYVISTRGWSLAIAASNMADKLTLNVIERYGDLELAGPRVAQLRNDLAAVEEHLRAIERAYGVYEWLCLTDESGTVIAATSKELVGSDFSSEPWFVAARQTGAVCVQDAHVSPEAAGLVCMSFAKSLVGTDGEFQGAVCAEVPLQNFDGIIRTTAGRMQDEMGALAPLEWQVMTENGTLIMDSILHEEGVANLKKLGLPSALLCTQATQPAYVLETHRRRHVPVVTGYARTSYGHGRFQGPTWGILVRIDRDYVVGRVGYLIRYLGIPAGLLFLTMSCALLWTAKRLKKEWSRLIEANAVMLALVQTAREFGGMTDRDALFGLLANRATEVTRGVAAVVGTVDGEGEKFRRVFTGGPKDAVKQVFGILPAQGPSLAAADFAGGISSQLISDGADGGRAPSQHTPWGPLLSASVMTHGQLRGCLYVAVPRRVSRRSGELQSLEEQAIAILAQQCAGAIENASLLGRLAASEARYRLLLDSALDGVYGVDSAGCCTFVNKSALRMLGCEESDVVGQEAHGLFHAPCDDRSTVRRENCEICRLSRYGLSGRLEDCMLCRANGSSFHAELAVAPIVVRDAVEGSVVTLTFRDTTEQIEAERKLRLAQQMDAVGRIAGGVAHDFNNILTAIIGYADLLQMVQHDDKQSIGRYAGEIQKSVKRGKELGQQLLAFSRHHVFQFQLIDLNQTIHERQLLLRSLLGESIELEVSQAPAPCVVLADASQIERVLMNVALNARDAMPGGGVMTVTTANLRPTELEARGFHASTRAGYVLLDIKDTGCGMDDDTQSHLFEPFFTTKAAGKGTGLGLATARAIVEQMEGQIRVCSTVGVGTTVSILLPAAGESLPHDQGTVLDHRSATPCGTQECVLVVEDEEQIRTMVQEYLDSHGYRVLVAAGAAEALRLWAPQQEVDVLVTDIVMPGMSGYELARTLKASRPDMRIVFISGHSEMHSRDDSLQEGVMFLQKPFALTELSQVITDLLGKGTKTNSASPV